MLVVPRFAWPSWRWITFSGAPSRASSTAWAWRSWCGAKAAPDSGLGREPAELDADVGARPGPPAGRAVDDAEQRADRELEAGGEPGRELFPAPGVPADLPRAAV